MVSPDCVLLVVLGGKIQLSTLADTTIVALGREIVMGSNYRKINVTKNVLQRASHQILLLLVYDIISSCHYLMGSMSSWYNIMVILILIGTLHAPYKAKL